MWCSYLSSQQRFQSGLFGWRPVQELCLHWCNGFCWSVRFWHPVTLHLSHHSYVPRLYLKSTDLPISLATWDFKPQSKDTHRFKQKTYYFSSTWKPIQFPFMSYPPRSSSSSSSLDRAARPVGFTRRDSRQFQELQNVGQSTGRPSMKSTEQRLPVESEGRHTIDAEVLNLKQCSCWRGGTYCCPAAAGRTSDLWWTHLQNASQHFRRERSKSCSSSSVGSDAVKKTSPLPTAVPTSVPNPSPVPAPPPQLPHFYVVNELREAIRDLWRTSTLSEIIPENSKVSLQMSLCGNHNLPYYIQYLTYRH